MTTERALLVAMMEPAPAFTDEFHEWYDTEHLPLRQAIAGFLATDDLAAFGPGAPGIDLANASSPHWRRGASHTIVR